MDDFVILYDFLPFGRSTQRNGPFCHRHLAGEAFELGALIGLSHPCRLQVQSDEIELFQI